MFNSDKKALIKELSKPEASDGSAFGMLGVGAMLFGGVAAPSITTAIGVVLGVAAPLMVAVGLGGAGYMVARRLLKKGERGEA